MFKVDHDPSSSRELLAAENVSLRLLLTQTKLSVENLLNQAGIDAKEREASDKLHKLILEELHHRIKNTLATVSAITSQSLRNAPGRGTCSARDRRPVAGCGTRSRTSCCRRGGPAQICESSSAG